MTAQPESTSGTLPGLAPPARRRRLGRAVAWLGFAVLTAVLAAIVKLLAPVWHDPTARFVERKGELVAVERESETHLDSSTIIERRLRSDTGLTVELSVRVPDGSAGPKPTLLLLGGHETGRDAVRLVAANEVIVAAISYPDEGLTGLRGFRAVMNVARYQRGVLDTVPSVLLAADYLVRQPYVATGKLELVGVSLGAFFVAPAGALDTRFRRVWIVHGSGDPHAVIEYALRREIASAAVRRAAAAALNEIAGGDWIAAERWVDHIAPRPVIVINARDDERLPRAGVEKLHSALGAGHEVVWTRGQHVEPGRADVLEQLRSEVLSRIR